MGNDLIKKVADYIGCDQKTVLMLSQKAGISYKIYTIPKKNGGQRRIFHPSRETKALQYALLSILLKDFKVHECAVAYRRGIKSPVLVNATKHAGFSYSIRIDFKDFFPSLKPNDLFTVLGVDKFSADEKNFLERALFLYYKGQFILTIGAPTSPIISNIIMFDMDEKIAALSKMIDEHSVYTRYADDIFFSTNRKGGCGKFIDGVGKLVAATNSPKLTINSKKTAYLSRGNRRQITGLTISPNGRISIGRSRKRMIKSLFLEYKCARLDEKSIASLRGHLAYIKDVEPSFINRLIL